MAHRMMNLDTQANLIFSLGANYVTSWGVLLTQEVRKLSKMTAHLWLALNPHYDHPPPIMVKNEFPKEIETYSFCGKPVSENVA